MKILFIHNFYRKSGGEDQVVAKEIELLQHHGHEVQLLSFQNHAFKKNWKGIQNLFHNQQSYQQVLTSINAFKPVLIHVHNFFYKASPAVFYAAKAKGIPVVLTFHNYRTICANALLMRNSLPCELCTKQALPLQGVRHKCFQNSTIKSALLTTMVAWHKHKSTWTKQVDHIIVLTQFAKQKFISSSLGIPEVKFLVKANSVDDYEVLPLKKRSNYVVFVGRLSPEKGIDVLLEAAKYTNVNIKIIGDGPLRDSVISCSNSYKQVEYLGQQSHSQVINIIQQSRGLLLPSVCYEGLPNTVLEAFSTGTPVIVSDIDNLNQIVSDQQNGLTFHTGNAQDLAKKLHLLVHETDKWEKLATQARNSYQTNYTHYMNYQQLITLYQQLTIT